MVSGKKFKENCFSKQAFFYIWLKYTSNEIGLTSVNRRQTVIATCVVSARHILCSSNPIIHGKPCLDPISCFTYIQNSHNLHTYFSYTWKAKHCVILYTLGFSPRPYAYANFRNSSSSSKYLRILNSVLVRPMDLIKYNLEKA